MHRIDDAIVHEGKLVLTDLPFAEGQHVRVIVAEMDQASKKISIHEVRELLRGSVDRFDAPFEPVIPLDEWEMMK